MVYNLCYYIYMPKNSYPGDKTGKSHFPIDIYPKQSWERLSHHDPKYGCHQRIPSHLQMRVLLWFLLLSETGNTACRSQSQVKIVLPTSCRLKKKKNPANYHSEDLIFIKAQFLFWHRANWLEVLRIVYTDYWSLSKSVIVGAASLWMLVKISPHISNISKRFCIWCLTLMRVWIWPLIVKIRGFSVENCSWTLWFDSGMVQSLEVSWIDPV